MTTVEPSKMVRTNILGHGDTDVSNSQLNFWTDFVDIQLGIRRNVSDKINDFVFIQSKN